MRLAGIMTTGRAELMITNTVKSNDAQKTKHKSLSDILSDDEDGTHYRSWKYKVKETSSKWGQKTRKYVNTIRAKRG